MRRLITAHVHAEVIMCDSSQKGWKPPAWSLHFFSFLSQPYRQTLDSPGEVVLLVPQDLNVSLTKYVL